MSLPTQQPIPQHGTPDDPDARRRRAKRMLSQVIDALPTDVLDAVVADSTFPRRVPASALSPYDIPEGQHASYLAAIRRERVAYLTHRLSAALMIDALRVQTAGSGVAVDDAVHLVATVMDKYEISDMRPTARSPESRARQWWEGNRSRVAPLVFQRDGSVCRYCGATADLTIDHLTPISRGGSNDMDNLGVACLPCNMQKKSKTEAEYYAWLADAAVTA